MSTARQENARTLASAIGSTEDKAAKLLDATVLITCKAPGGERLSGFHIAALLARTLKRVHLDPDGVPALEVVVGAVEPRTDTRRVFVGVDGYCLKVSDTAVVAHSPEARPIVELVAACYAAAAAAHRALDVELAVPLRLPIVVDLAKLYEPAIDRLDGRIDVGIGFMAGAGAIGNAVIAGFSVLDIHGKLHICDPDDASGGNLNRCWWFGPEDLGKPKAERLGHHARPSMQHLELVPHVASAARRGQRARRARGGNADRRRR